MAKNYLFLIFICAGCVLHRCNSCVSPVLVFPTLLFWSRIKKLGNQNKLLSTMQTLHPVIEYFGAFIAITLCAFFFFLGGGGQKLPLGRF